MRRPSRLNWNRNSAENHSLPTRTETDLLVEQVETVNLIVRDGLALAHADGAQDL
jgi:hypothetical protein